MIIHRHALTQIDHGFYHPLVHADKMLTCTRKAWGKKASKICRETAKKKKKHSSCYTTANRQRQHCWQTQVKARERQNDNGKFKDQPKWMEKKKASYHGAPTGVSEKQSFAPFQESQFIALCWCCPVINPQGY